MPIGIYDRANRIEPLQVRFNRKINVNNETKCWEWTGARNSFGHGQIYKGGPASGGRKLLMAHRVSWEIHCGPIQSGMCVLHKCDVPWCVNPDHLFIGTKAENSADMVAKNRQRKGETLPQTKLTANQVDAIRKCNLTQKQIASLCGVSQSLISQIKAGKYWSGSP